MRVGKKFVTRPDVGLRRSREALLIAMVSYAVAHQAYLKIIIHAAKHPHLPVNGVLLGKPSSSGTVLIEDAIPLLHHWTSLSPMMEIALDLVSLGHPVI